MKRSGVYFFKKALIWENETETLKHRVICDHVIKGCILHRSARYKTTVTWTNLNSSCLRVFSPNAALDLSRHRTGIIWSITVAIRVSCESLSATLRSACDCSADRFSAEKKDALKEAV